MPEVAEELNMEGRSLVPFFNSSVPEPEEPLFLAECTCMKRKGVRTDEWKLIVDWGGTPAHYKRPDVELYDLKSDPGQKRNLARKYPEVCKKMQSSVIKFLRDEGASDEYINKFLPRK